MPSIFAPMKIDDIAFGRVERRVTVNGKERRRGDELSHADLASMATANRNAMIENRMITVFPKSVHTRGGFGAEGPALAAIEGEFHIVTVGFGKYRVIKGHLLLENATKDAAAEFVAAEQAKIGVAAPASAVGPANPDQAAAEGQPQRPVLRRRGSRRKKRGQRHAPAAPTPTPGDNGPVESE